MWPVVAALVLVLAGCSFITQSAPPVRGLKPTAKGVRKAPADLSESEAGPSISVWRWPARGVVSQRVDGTAATNGLDISGPRGAPVRASAAGRVVYVGSGLRGYGKLIIIKHGTSILTAYGHNELVLVVEGQAVKEGESIAEMGDSDADRVKLHFEVREYGKPVAPLIYLPG